jgi:DNA-binding IclR family transcriptional regulator
MNEDPNRSALRAFQIFGAFRDAGRPLSLSEIARLAKLPVSTCHGVLKTLERSGFLYFVSPRDCYPTRKLFDLTIEINAKDPITRRLEPALTALRDDLNETIILGLRQDTSVIYLLVLESAQAIRYSSRAGEQKPLHSSAIGKVILGSMSIGDLDRWFATTRLEKITDETITSEARLKAHLSECRGRGYYATYGENVSDVMGLAAPLRIGNTVFGVAVAGPIQRMLDKETDVKAKLLEVLGKLEMNFGTNEGS